MKQLVIRCATALFKCIYLLANNVVGPKDRIVCLSRQANGTTVDFELIKRYIAEHNPDFSVTICAKTISNPLGYMLHMLRQTWLVATSRAVLLDSYCIVVSLLGDMVHAPVIQLWHAMGNMKRFGYTALNRPEGRSSDLARLMHMHEGYDCIVISSMSFVTDYAAGFNVNPRIIFECPLPKADLFRDPAHRAAIRERILARYPKLGDKRTIVYCPTFRKPATERDRQALAELSAAVDFTRYNLVYKRHPISTLRFEDDRVLQDYDPGLDMLFVADCVISDYSTVIYEAGLMDLPIYLYTYDWDTYEGRRGLNIDFEHDVPAPVSNDAQKLVQLIEQDIFDEDAFRVFMSKNVRLPAKGTCTKRLVAHIFEMIEAPKA